MIDESAAYRAALKQIYYLIWVRDSAFSFAYQAATGWPHKLSQLSRLLLDNPLSIKDGNAPSTRAFGQLVNRTHGKREEEDGIYYVVWTLFTEKAQNGRLGTITTADWTLIAEALAWVEKTTWDEERGLFGEHFADEPPTHAHRDFGWDYAIGKPIGTSDVLTHSGQAVVRNYDVYFNTIMHSCYVMLAALRQDQSYLDKAEKLWTELSKLYRQKNQGVPVYGEQLLVDGTRSVVPHWGQASSCCVWRLAMPNFLPLEDSDAILEATIEAIIESPEMHWINGICSAIAAVDTWTYPEEKLIQLHCRIVDETNRLGRYLPMAGAMPEKFAAPEGNLYHDIRPQGFAMGAWLAAWTSLGLRRLPYGLAVRPTKAFETISNYQWRGKKLDVLLTCPESKASYQLLINDDPVVGTLQLPEDSVSLSKSDSIKIELKKITTNPDRASWIRSTVQLDSVSESGKDYKATAFGLSSITFSQLSEPVSLLSDEQNPIAYYISNYKKLSTIHFTHFGKVRLCLDRRYKR